MRSKRCDRCGRFYEVKEEESRASEKIFLLEPFDRKNNEDLKVVHNLNISFKTTNCDTIRFLDLCPECYERLKSWLLEEPRLGDPVYRLCIIKTFANDEFFSNIEFDKYLAKEFKDRYHGHRLDPSDENAFLFFVMATASEIAELHKKSDKLGILVDAANFNERDY